MAGNQLCGVTSWGSGTYTAEGITKLCEGLKGSAVTSLKCAAAPKAFAFVSAPADTPDLTIPTLLLAPSLYYNRIGDQGAIALAEGLKGNSTLQSLK